MAEIQSRPWPVLSAKQVAYILYNVEQDRRGPLFHQRWLLGMAAGCPSEAIFVSPDGDVQSEVVDGSSADILSVVWADTLDPKPPSVTRRYCFVAPPKPEELRQWGAEAVDEAKALYSRKHPRVPVPPHVYIAYVPVGVGGSPPAAPPPVPGPGAPGAGDIVAVAAAPAPPRPPRPGGLLGRGVEAPPPPAAGAAATTMARNGVVAPYAPPAAATKPMALQGGAGAATTAPSGAWRVAMEWRGHHYGDPIDPPAGFVGQGEPPRGVVLLEDGSGLFIEWVATANEGEFTDRAVAVDARILPVRVDRGGYRARTIDQVIEESTQEHVPGMVEPRTTLWCLGHLRAEGKGLEAHFEHFKTLCNLKHDQWGMEEYDQLVVLARAFLFTDQYDPTNSTGMELLFRRLQIIEYSYSDRLKTRVAQAQGGLLTPEEQAAFAGYAKTESRLMICPSLVDMARKELSVNAELAKSIQKSREARVALAKKTPG